MKFLFIGTDPEAGGGATHFAALARALADAGHPTAALAYPAGLIAEQLAGSAVSIYPARFRNVLSPRAYRVAARAISEHQPDWLVGNFGREYWPILLLGRRYGIHTALFRHRIPPMKRWSSYLIPRLADRFLAVSDYARQIYLDRGLPAARVQLLHNSVDTETFHPDPLAAKRVRAELGLPAEAIVLGFVGRMHGGKGIFTLLEAMQSAMASEPRLYGLWIGEGPEGEELNRQIAAGPYPERHRRLGWCSAPQAYFPAFSIFAFPTLMAEPFGRVAIEAQACGVPVLASAIGGVGETLTAGDTGRLLPPGDVASWQAAIIDLCDDGQRERLAAATRPFILRHYSNAVIAQRFVELLRTGR